MSADRKKIGSKNQSIDIIIIFFFVDFFDNRSDVSRIESKEGFFSERIFGLRLRRVM